jgi:hypothetical protein
MIKNSRPSLAELVIQEGATALVGATFAFLRRNNISKKLILKSVQKADGSHGRVRHYRRLVRAYEDMGIVMSTWYSLPSFLDSDSRPLPLTTNRGVRSVANLVRLSRVRIRLTLAIELLRRSPSVRIDVHGNFVATKRVFVLPDFEVPRAALVIQRYLDTLRKNTSAQKKGTSLLLERNCHVPEIDVRRISPILRDIKERGTAFMDSVDGDIEAHRTPKSRQAVVGELGVLIFAWTRPSTPRRSKASLVNQLGDRASATAHRSIPKARAR